MTNYIMRVPVVSMFHLTEKDRRLLAEAHARDMDGLATEDAPLIAAYPGGYFVWCYEVDLESMALSDQAKLLFKSYAKECGAHEGNPLALRFDEAVEVKP